MPYGNGWGPSPWGWLAIMALMVIFWLILLLATMWGLRWRYERGAGQRSDTPIGTALEILQQRYARGELTTEQYREMKRELEAEGTV